MAIANWPYQPVEPFDPQATLDYQLDWTRWLAAGETIVDSQWSVDGAEKLDSGWAGAKTTVWVSAPTGSVIRLTNTITTDSIPVARVEERTLVLRVAQK